MPMEHHDPHYIEQTVRELLAQQAVRTQTEIKSILEKQGIPIDQSTISRVLRKISATKTLDAQGQSIYKIGEGSQPLSPQISLTELVLSINHNEHMIIVRTSPGAAMLIARYLDHHREELQLLGTVAGDDTVFVVPERVKIIKKIMNGVKFILAI
jgi:transcriptional regulator of arginine metabolism